MWLLNVDRAWALVRVLISTLRCDLLELFCVDRVSRARAGQTTTAFCRATLAGLALVAAVLAVIYSDCHTSSVSVITFWGYGALLLTPRSEAKYWASLKSPVTAVDEILMRKPTEIGYCADSRRIFLVGAIANHRLAERVPKREIARLQYSRRSG
jgi:hypothetical protein